MKLPEDYYDDDHYYWLEVMITNAFIRIIVSAWYNWVISTWGRIEVWWTGFFNRTVWKNRFAEKNWTSYHICYWNKTTGVPSHLPWPHPYRHLPPTFFFVYFFLLAVGKPT